MPDSLLFDGSDDSITMALGGVTPFGGSTVAAIVKRASTGSEDVFVRAQGSGYWALKFGSLDDVVYDSDVGADGLTITVGTDWRLVAVSKATGSAVVRFHFYDGSTWTHQNGSTSLANSGAVSGGDVTIGSFTGFDPFPGNILIAGFWNSVLSDGALEALTSYTAWVSAAPIEGWKCDTASAIQSFGTTGTADETGRTGTTVDTGDVPSWWSEAPAPKRDFSWHFG